MVEVSLGDVSRLQWFMAQGQSSGTTCHANQRIVSDENGLVVAASWPEKSTLKAFHNMLPIIFKQRRKHYLNRRILLESEGEIYVALLSNGQICEHPEFRLSKPI